ncbi:protein-export chaperone SecB [Pseudoalteromonas umbrosa]|uniref:protein-export chaperone SecB n=1 Tax=Pseudoalteromonas umbrosa TaxID=3048489 RepID=UPI0024C3E68D|nr:protein-export chaperone SecB [Pseudoalteromonas sp. B95]MDK1290115.1 protein-export chaperone SecB [Pseudoalteromonas sp. B95]
MSEQQTEYKFELQKIYFKNSTFSTEDTPAVFLEEWKPAIEIDLKTRADKLSDSTYEVVVEVIASVTDMDNPEKGLFKASVEQAGIFDIEGYTEQELVGLLGSHCPAQLYPYARHHIAELALHGGFPQMLLAPVNFDEMLEQAVKDAEAAAQTGE